jgi:hypothetical protein
MTRRLRVTFVGQETYFRACALDGQVDGLVPAFVDFRAGADPGQLAVALEATRPDVVICFRPELIPVGLFAGLGAAKIGFVTEPLPRPGEPPHADLERRLEDFGGIDAGNFDRIVSFDPLIAPSIEEFVPVWRSLPLPVADRFFGPVSDVDGPGRPLFVGRSTPHREQFLTPCKHEFDLLHVAHGLSDERLTSLFSEYPVAINLHNEPYPTFENRVAMHLAAAQLVITEPLSPTHGLEPGLDFVQVTSPGEMHLAVATAYHRPAAFRRIRLRGRQKAERFRASAVYPRLVSDLLADLRALGSGAARRHGSSLARPGRDRHLPADVEEERPRTVEREQLPNQPR